MIVRAGTQPALSRATSSRWAHQGANEMRGLERSGSAHWCISTRQPGLGSLLLFVTPESGTDAERRLPSLAFVS